MKTHILAVVILAFAVAAIATPRNKRQLSYDEPRLSNEVLPGAIDHADETSQEVITTAANTEDSTTEATTKTPALDDAPTPRPGNKKKKPNTGSITGSDTFSRVIDDIFNIPISVLRAVNTLLSNTFGGKPAAESAPVVTSSGTTAA